MEKYTIATEGIKLYDYVDMEESKEDAFRELLRVKQDKILMHELGANCFDKTFYMIRHKSDWIKKDYAMLCDIDDVVNMLAIKDGVDLIRFENGNLGYVAYYNGMEDVVEIVAKKEDIEKFINSKDGNNIDVDEITEELENIVLHSLEEIKEHIDNYYC